MTAGISGVFEFPNSLVSLSSQFQLQQIVLFFWKSWCQATSADDDRRDLRSLCISDKSPQFEQPVSKATDDSFSANDGGRRLRQTMTAGISGILSDFIAVS